MGWLAAKKTEILRLAGYADNVTGADDSITFAEATIEAFTGAIWGAETNSTLTVRLDARAYLLPLPTDTTAATVTAPALTSGYTTSLTLHGLEVLDEDELPVSWAPGAYKLSVTRGRSSVPADVVKAASLLASHYLGLSDPERSRYAGLALGDFTGTMRLAELPVPEAAALLARYRASRVGVSG